MLSKPASSGIMLVAGRRSMSSVLSKVSTCSDDFVPRHLDLNAAKTQSMLKKVGVSTMTELTDKVVPENIRLNRRLDMEGPIGMCILVWHGLIQRAAVQRAPFRPLTPRCHLILKTLRRDCGSV